MLGASRSKKIGRGREREEGVEGENYEEDERGEMRGEQERLWWHWHFSPRVWCILKCEGKLAKLTRDRQGPHNPRACSMRW